MGAILLIRRDADISIQNALEPLGELGLNDPIAFEYGEWGLYAVPKAASTTKNYKEYKDCKVICAGTPIYKGLDYNDSLTCIIQDFYNKKLNLEELLGQYTIVFCHEGKISVLLDPMNTKHLFIDKDKTIISSSVLSIASGLKRKVHIDRNAVYEKLLTGFIMKPKTIFQEISQVSYDEFNTDKQIAVGINYILNEKPLDYGKRRKVRRENCIQEQVKTLITYYSKLANASVHGIDIGLSGGYDSRLTLACMNECYPDKLHLHTHATKGVHMTESAVALKLSDCVGKRCNIVSTKQLKDSDKLDETLLKSVIYFDGRTSFAIGGCGEVYTLDYRQRSTENTPMTVTGVGGELYRNVFSIGGSTITLNSFLRCKVFSSSMQRALRKDLYEIISDDLVSRVANRLGVEKDERVSKSVAHRYYCEIMMPDGQGNAVDAYNQVSCCVAPYIEPDIIRKGYESIRFHGQGGDFEGEIIDVINHELASIESTYGYALNHRTAKVKLKDFARSITPDDIWNRLGRIKNKSSSVEEGVIRDLEEICKKSELLKRALHTIYERFPEINFNYLIGNKEENKRIVFLAVTLEYLRNKIEF